MEDGDHNSNDKKTDDGSDVEAIDYLKVDKYSGLRPRNVLFDKDGQLFYHANLATGVVTARDAGFIRRPKIVKQPIKTPLQLFLTWYRGLPPDDRKQVDIIFVFLFFITILFVALAIWIFGAGFLCTSKACHISADRLRNSMMPKIKPCYDFFGFSCGKWERKYPVIAGELYSSRKQEQYATTWQYAQKILTSVNPNLDPYGLQVASSLYNSCMNADARTQLGKEPLRRELAQLGLPPGIPTKETAASFRLSRTIALAKRYLNLDILMKFDIQPADLPYKKKLFQFSPSIGPPIQESFKSMKYNKVFEERKNILRAISNIDIDIDAKVLKSMQKTIAIEEVIMKISKPHNNASEWYTFSDLKEFTAGTDKFDWDEYETTIFEGFNKTMGDSGHVGQLLLDVLYFQTLAQLLSDTEMDILQQIVWWNVVERLGPLVGLQELADVGDKEYIDSNTERSHQCVIQVVDIAPDPICYRMYHDNFVSRADRDLERMMYNIHISFDRNVNQGFLHHTVLEKMIVMEKIVSIKIQLGCPNHAKNESDIEELFLGVELVAEEYVRNWQIIQTKNFETIMNRLGTFYGYEEFYHWRSWQNYNPLTIEPYYVYSANTIVVSSVAIREHSLYGFGVKGMDYGAMAVRLAIEAFKGVDRRGQFYHKNGTRVPSWFSKETLENFSKRGACLLEQFKQYKVNGKSVDMTFMVDDITAEVAGLSLAYEGYKLYQKTFRDPQLKWLTDYNTRQLFFLSFAQFTVQVAGSCHFSFPTSLKLYVVNYKVIHES